MAHPPDGSKLDVPSMATAVPSMATAPAFMTNARDVQFHGGTYSVIGGDVHNHYHFHGSQVDIWAVLRTIPNFRKIHQDTIAKATEGTGRWLLETEEFRMWLDANGDIKILWGSGIAGAGKTIVASIVIAHLEALAEADSQVSVAYVYIRYSDRAQVTVHNMLETLVRQIVERHPDYLPLFEQVYAKHLREDSEPTEEQLLSLLKSFSKGKRAYYVLDAIDEAPPEVQLEILTQLSTLDVRLFITSRPLKALEACLPQARHLTIAAKDHDLDLHIAKVIQRSVALQHLLGDPDSVLRKEVVSLIKKKCRGMFLHASLQLDAIGHCASVCGIKQRLATFPPRIEEVYLQTWERVVGQSADEVLLAKTALLWVLTAARSMTIDQLRYAVATCPETHRFEEDRLVPEVILLQCCCGLLILEEETRLVRLVHYTAKDTLTRLILDTFPHPHSVLAAVCITYLTDRGLQDTRINSKEGLDAALAADPLLAYAYRGWAFHSRHSLDDKATAAQVAAFVAGCKAFPSVLRNVLDFLGPLHVVAAHNLPTALVGKSPNPNIMTKNRGETPLGLACSLGHKARVREFLALPNILVNNADRDGRTALMGACRKGHEGIVRLFLARPDTKVSHVDNNGWSAFMVACLNGHRSIVKLLLAHPDIKVDRVSNAGSSAFMLACEHGHEGIVKLLLAHPNTKVDVVNKDGRTAFIQACQNGHESIVKLLLAHPDTKVGRATKAASSAFMLACKNGHEGIVKLLLAHPETEVDRVNNDGLSALMLACRYGQEGIVKLLLANAGTKVDAVNKKMCSAFMFACERGHQGVVRLLLAHPDTKVNRRDSHGTTALLLAAERGHAHVVKLLLAVPDIDVNSVDGDGDTAIKVAAEKGYEEIVCMLLEIPGINVTATSIHTGHTALSAALANGQSAIVQLLQDFQLRHGIPASITPNFENTVPDEDKAADRCEVGPDSGSDWEDSDVLEELQGSWIVVV